MAATAVTTPAARRFVEIVVLVALFAVVVLLSEYSFEFRAVDTATSVHKIAKNNHTAPSINASSSTRNTTAVQIDKQNHTSKNLPSLSQNYTTLIVQLGGEMGNHLSYLSSGVGMQLLAKEEFNLNLQIEVQHQENRKWTAGNKDLHNCFPHWVNTSFSGGQFRQPDYDTATQLQTEWLGNRTFNFSLSRDCHETAIECTRHILTNLQASLQLSPPPLNTSITVPRLLVHYLWAADFSFIDRYYETMKHVFRFDEQHCCAAVPEPDETVFHLRNFLKEMPKKGNKLGFEELSPNRTARVLFGNLQEGDKIAIATRFGGSSVQPYVSALEERGLKVRVIAGQSGVQDFCFLLKAQKELVGIAQSTYVTWAAFLGNTSLVRLYSVDSPPRRARYGTDGVFFRYNWAHPNLKERIHFELYNRSDSGIQ